MEMHRVMCILTWNNHFLTYKTHTLKQELSKNVKDSISKTRRPCYDLFFDAILQHRTLCKAN